MTNHLFIQLILVISLWSSISISASSQISTPPTIDTQELIDEDDWLKLAQQIFLEARSTYKFEPGIIIGQAKGGFIQDALDTIEGLHPTSQSGKLISLLRNASVLSKEKRNELIQKAINAARENTYKSAPHNLKSGELINIALYYSSQGDDNHSKELFYEAIREAEAGLTEVAGNSYQRITDRLNWAPAEEIKPWMLEIIRANFRKTKNAKDLAYTCRDMAEVAFKIHDHDQATMYIKCAESAIKNIKKSRLQKHAIKQLDKTKDKLHYASGSETGSRFSQAIREARSGNIKKSYEIVSKLRDNLYVDPKLSAYQRIFKDAIKRNDLITAKYFAERPVRELPYVAINTWTTLAEKQVENGDEKSALMSYEKASSELDKISTSKIVYDSHIKSILQLSASMLRNNLKTDARKTLLLAQQLLEKIPKHRLNDRIKASIFVSEALWQNKRYNEAKQFFKNAYEYTHLYDTNKSKLSKRYSDTSKAQLLSTIGQLAVTFGTNK